MALITSLLLHPAKLQLFLEIQTSWQADKLHEGREGIYNNTAQSRYAVNMS